MTEALDELRMHEVLIAESRRKIAELEHDRPLWEAAARARERQEREEEEERRAAYERRKREEAEALARAEEERRVEAERKWERARQAEAEAKAKAEAEAAAKRRAEAQRARWARGPWTSQRALERYRVLCESFDEAAKPTSLTFEDIPWPALSAPFTFGPKTSTGPPWKRSSVPCADTCARRITASLLRSRTGGSIPIDGAHGDYLPQ